MKKLTENTENNHLVPLKDYAVESQCIYLIMPLYELGSLRDYVKKNGRLSQDTGELQLQRIRVLILVFQL